MERIRKEGKKGGNKGHRGREKRRKKVREGGKYREMEGIRKRIRASER